MSLKICTSCKKEKALEEFGNHVRTKDGKTSKCKTCYNSRVKELRKGKGVNSKKQLFGLGILLYCPCCQLHIHKDNFYKRKNVAECVTGYCKPCAKAARKDYYERNKEELLNKEKEQRWNLRLSIIEAYGGKCECCGETQPQFLTIDHIYDDGADHRRELGTGSKKIYKWLTKNNYPKDRFQLLCYNCNCAKGCFGICPHKLNEVK